MAVWRLPGGASVLAAVTRLRALLFGAVLVVMVVVVFVLLLTYVFR